MKKVLLTVVAIACITTASLAQGRFSVGAEVALPSGDWSDLIGTGFGGSVRYEAPINDNINWMATAGYLAFGEKDDLGYKYSMIPVMGGIKYYFTESFNGFYAGAELGIAFATVKNDDLDFDESDSEFGFAPSLGYHLGSFDISAKYLLISDANSIGFRVAYVLGGN